MSESFNSVLKVEFVHRHDFATRAEARIRIATWRAAATAPPAAYHRSSSSES